MFSASVAAAHHPRRPRHAGRRPAAPALLLAACLLVAGCARAPVGNGLPTPGQVDGGPGIIGGTEPGAFQLGVLLPLTGPDADLGRSAEAAIRLALSEAGLGGDDGRLRTVFADTGGDPAGAVRAADGFVTDRATIGLIAVADDRAAFAVAAMAERARIPLLVVGSADDLLLERSEYVFRVGPSDSLSAGLAARAVVGVLDERRAAMVASAAEPRSARIAAAFRASLAASGGRIAAQVAGDGEPPALDPDAAERLADSRPGAVFLADVATALPAWLAELGKQDALGDTPRLLPLPAPLRPAEQQALAEALRGDHPEVLAVVPFHADGGTHSRSFAAAFRQSSGRTPDAAGALAYDAARLLAAGLTPLDAATDPRSADVTTVRKAVRDALVNLPAQEGATGPLDFDRRRDATAAGYVVRLRAAGDGVESELVAPVRGEGAP